MAAYMTSHGICALCCRAGEECVCYERVMDILRLTTRASISKAIQCYLVGLGIHIQTPKKVLRLIPPSNTRPTTILLGT